MLPERQCCEATRLGVGRSFRDGSADRQVESMIGEGGEMLDHLLERGKPGEVGEGGRERYDLPLDPERPRDICGSGFRQPVADRAIQPLITNRRDDRRMPLDQARQIWRMRANPVQSIRKDSTIRARRHLARHKEFVRECNIGKLVG